VSISIRPMSIKDAVGQLHVEYRILNYLCVAGVLNCTSPDELENFPATIEDVISVLIEHWLHKNMPSHTLGADLLIFNEVKSPIADFTNFLKSADYASVVPQFKLWIVDNHFFAWSYGDRVGRCWDLVTFNTVEKVEFPVTTVSLDIASFLFRRADVLLVETKEETDVKDVPQSFSKPTYTVA